MSDVRFSISVDANQGRRGMQEFRAGYKALVDQLSVPLGQIGAFRDLEASLVQNGAQLNATREKLRDMANELIKTERPTKAQQAAYRALTGEARSMEQAIAGQKGQLAELSSALKNAGVDTTRLGNEQKRLAADLAQATRATEQQARIAGAREALGVRPHREIRNEIVQLQRQYQVLQRTGMLTTAELAQAKVRLRERVAELQVGTNGWAESLSQVHLQAGAAVAGMGAIIYAGGSLLKFYAQYAQQIAAVDSITDMSREKLKLMSDQVRELSVAMGRDAAQSAAALNDILSSGVSEDNGIATLELSTKAAIAGLTQTATAAQGGLAVVNAYGEGIENLELRYDQMFLTVRDGVTTFDDLARFIGDALPTAKAAGVGFDEVSAAIARMTIAGIRTPQATTALKGAINALAAPTPDAAEKMAELGISWRGLTNTLEDIAALDLSIADMRELVPDTEARTAVLSLTQDIAAMRAEVLAMASAAGSMEAAYGKFSQTPQAELDRFNASWGELKLQLGEAATAFLPLVEVAGEALNAFNSLPDSVQTLSATILAGAASLTIMRSAYVALRNPFALFLGHMSTTPAAAAGAAQRMGGMGAAAVDLVPKLRTLADVARLAKGALVLGVVAWTGGQLAELYQAIQGIRELEQAQRDHQKALSDTAQETIAYADTVILPAASVARMTEIERQAYAERLRLADQHYRAQGELLSRQDTSANINQDALASQRRATEFRRALSAIENEHAERESAEKRHKDAVATIKSDELKVIQDALGKEILAYDEASKKLEAANKKTADAMKARADLAKEFAQLVQDMKAPAGDDGPATFSDVTALKAGARQSLQRGDSEGAIRQAREAAEVLRELKESGANSYGFAGIAGELALLADEAAKLDGLKADVERIDAMGRVDEIKARMDDLLAQAEAMKRVNIEFTGFEQSAETLEQQAKDLAARLKQYMIIPINYIGAGADQVAAGAAANENAGNILGGKPIKRAGGGWIDGPGTPTSDSVPMLASRNEFMLNAWSAQRLGATNLEHMNRTGELPGRDPFVPDFPTLPAMDRIGERQPLNLSMPWGGNYALQGSPSEVARFQDDLERARIKFGNRS